MKRLPEDSCAKLVPVRAGIDKVEMPCLIDLIRRRHRMPRPHGQKQEPSVFLNHALRKVALPAILSHQSLSESQLSARGVELKGLKL